jgi:GAF domain-containing protein
VEKISSGDLTARANINTQDETGVLADAFNSMAENLSEVLVTLEERVNERTDELQKANKTNLRRAARFEAIARLAHAISNTQELEILLPQITEIISGEFEYYHVGIFLLDTRKEYAVLVAANSEGGQRMLARNHRLLVGETGIVGYATRSGQPRIALNVGQDAAYFNNPDLPSTRSEVALPLRFGDEIIGALDVQSTEQNAFSEEDINIFSALADQVSVAIQNARTYQQMREALNQAEAASAQLSGKAWQEMSSRKMLKGFSFDGVNITNVENQSQQSATTLTIPLLLRGVKIGSVNLNPSDPNRAWTDDEIAMVQAAAERTAFAIENARLLQEAQKRAAKERTIGEISSKIGSLGNIESIIQTAIKELGATLPNTDIAIQFTSNKNGSGTE